jgi:uncharacterized protein YciU (UPF0263 family)
LDFNSRVVVAGISIIFATYTFGAKFDDRGQAETISIAQQTQQVADYLIGADGYLSAGDR